MTERMTFKLSGLVKDPSNLKEIEFWGHDAGEFTEEEVEEIIKIFAPKETTSDKKPL